MHLRPRFAVLVLALLIVLAACAPDPGTSGAAVIATATQAPPTATPSPTIVPSPTPVPRFAAGSTIAGVDVSGLTAAEATVRLETLDQRLQRSLVVNAGSERISLDPAAFDLTLPIDELVTSASSAAAAGEPVAVPRELRLDEQALRAELEPLAAAAGSGSATTIITSTDVFSRSFAYAPGAQLDLDAAVETVASHLQTSPSRWITLDLQTVTPDAPPRAGFDEIAAQVDAMAAEWNGVVGFYLYDLASGDTIELHPNTVFSGASVMKVAIMLFSYVNIAEFNDEQEVWLRKMIVSSDNMSANLLLAAATNGRSTEDSLAGARLMSAWLQELGLQHTYQYMPYEASDYLIDVRGIRIQRGPPQEGDPPYTEADPVLRTTPAEISKLFLWIDECSRAEGMLLERFENLTPARCQEMLDRLARNGDDTRMVAGIPAGIRVEHKGGWVGDMQGDVGIVRSPGGDYLLAVYVYQQTDWLRDWVAAPVLASFSRMVYTAYNPLNLAEIEP